ncbi:MAG: GNAT family N-acetyltransferase [Oceanospirillaceae bacterium]|nr:GNAT family N-acetyltransferase [Oceanospirillaceae bacterium]MCP5334451.1 GNAT family N-acetyltransferase [Oceanospirillaceae bacterium]MCP5350841.1 GNAT family N-acetyltransferase [Oceanospirillaceae bacterium]
MELQIIQANFHNPQHAEHLLELLDMYARDPMGGGEPLSEYVRQNLIQELNNLPHAVSLLAYYQHQPVGVLNGFMGFSTFRCKPLLNIHDIAVRPEHRGLGIARALLDKAEHIARQRGCGKLTLEVLEGNHNAQKLYRAAGYAGYALDPQMGHALFWEKHL